MSFENFSNIDETFMLGPQAQQVFYLKDRKKNRGKW